MAIIASLKLTEILPQEHRDAVRYEGKPPPNCWAGFVGWSGGPQMLGGENDASLRGPDETPWGHTYSAILTFRQLGFMFMGFPDPIPAGYVIGSGSYPVAQVWPAVPGLVQSPPAGTPADPSVIEDLYRFAPLMPSA